MARKKGPSTAEQSRPGFKLRHIFEGHQKPISSLAWTPDGNHLISTSFDQSVKIWGIKEAAELHTVSHSSWVNDCAVTPDGKRFVTASSDYTLKVWDFPDCRLIHTLTGHALDVWTVSISADGRQILSGSHDQTLKLWDLTKGQQLATLKGHTHTVLSVMIARDGSWAISGSDDDTIRVWDLSTGEVLHTLKGHTKSVRSLVVMKHGAIVSASMDGTIKVWDLKQGDKAQITLQGHTKPIGALSISSDERLLASASFDNTVRLWDCQLLNEVGLIPVESKWFPVGLAFHPTSPILATVGGPENTIIQIWDIDLKVLLPNASDNRRHHYTNAKVVLLGETNAGKTCLARALMGETFEPQESTHGMKVWNFYSETTERNNSEQITRETLLWDLAGQVDYQVVHQLFLDETVLGVVMFDPTHPENPFAGVGHWETALTRVAGEDCPRLLVAGRVDRGYPTATADDIEAFRKQHKYQQFIATSAKTGQGIDELRKAIRLAIPWERLPVTSSPELWNWIREFLLQRRSGDDVLTRRVDLREAFRQKYVGTEFTEAEYDKVIGHVQTQGLMWQLSFGDFVLLKPELLNNYAAAIVRAARRQAEGLGCVPEQHVVEAAIDFEDLERLPNPETERSLLHAVVQLFLERELALRESGQLVFPSKFNRQRPDIPESQSREVAYRFAGAVEEIYATLVVRLFYCEAFTLKNLWKNGADFHDALDSLCGFTLDRSVEGQGVISVFFSNDTPDSSKVLFLRFIHDHLRRRATEDSVHRERIYRCPGCGEEVENRRAVHVRLSMGKASVPCQFCDTSIALVDVLEAKFANPELTQQIRALETGVADKKRQAVGVTVADAKQSVGEYDVFLAHNNADKPQVEAVGQALRRCGLNPWLDKEQIPPGRSFQDVIQQAIRHVKSAAIFIGPYGLGRWEIVELRSFISQCVERNIPVIPVLLPGVIRIPEELVFLQEFSWVKFTDTVDEAEVLDSLQWGITGNRPAGGEGSLLPYARSGT